MSLLWIFQLSGAILLQLFVSLRLISSGMKRLSYVSELTFLAIAIAFARYGETYIQKFSSQYVFSWNVICCCLIEYVLMKMLLLIIVYFCKLISFNCLVHINKNKGCYLEKFQKTFNRWWYNVDYGIRVKKGKPSMVKKRESKTKVKFDKNGFPEFYSYATIKLPRKMLHKEREEHKYYASKALYRNKRLIKRFNITEQKYFREGKTPKKYTWHHHQDTGVMQLVDRNIHADTPHKGGYSIWGKR